MKPSHKYIALILLMGGLWSAFGAGSGSATTNAPVLLPKSIFEVPTNVKNGRDPFFPESTRMSEVAAASNGNVGRVTTEVSSLKVPGISGTPGHMFAIINNHTFSVGDEGDVLTPNGRVHLRCLEIDTDGVVVQIAGRIHKLKLESE